MQSCRKRKQLVDNGSDADSVTACRPRRNTQRRSLFEEETAISREEQKLLQRALYASLRECDAQRQWVYVDRQGEVIDFYQPPVRNSKRRRDFFVAPPRISSPAGAVHCKLINQSASTSSSASATVGSSPQKSDAEPSCTQVRHCAKRKFAEGFGCETTEQNRLFETSVRSPDRSNTFTPVAAPRVEAKRNFAFKLPVRELLKRALSASQPPANNARKGTARLLSTSRVVRIETRDEFLQQFGVAHILNSASRKSNDLHAGSNSSSGQATPISRNGQESCDRCIRVAKQRKLECFVDRLRTAAIDSARSHCDCAMRRDPIGARIVLIRESRAPSIVNSEYQ